MAEDLSTIKKQADAFKSKDDSVVFKHQNVWYYKSPDGDKVGPFRYQSEAESSLEQFIRQLKDRLSVQ